MPETPINAEYVFWEGSAQLIAGPIRSQVNCRVYLPTSPREGLRIKVENPSPLASQQLPNEELSYLEIPGVADRIEMGRVGSVINPINYAGLEFRPMRLPIWFTSAKRLRSGRTAVINFAQYWMSGSQDQRFELRACGWTARFIPIAEKILTVAKTMQDENYRITHQVEFEREDGSLFTASQARGFLDNLSLFLSFCRGQWVATSFTVAVDMTGEMALEQWGTGRVSSWQDPTNWLDLYHGNAIQELYQPFCSKLEDESWKEAIAHVVYWFTRAETNNVGPDGACILLQATLERFAWQLLVRERKMVSEKGFGDLTAADQLRLMLNVLSIPTAIPNGLIQLEAFAKPKRFEGPEAFTSIRNRLVHPLKATGGQERVPYYQAYCLAKWYVELAVLSICGYTGDYSNRTLNNRWVGQVQKVPWA